MGISVGDAARSKAFYAKALAPLGIEVTLEYDGWVGRGKEGKPEFWFSKGDGDPGIRAQYHPNYFGAFVLDPDGHNIEAVCHRPE